MSNGRRDEITIHETTYGRRNFLTWVITVLHATIGGTLAMILGGSILAPSFARRNENWVPAGSLDDLVDDEPIPVTIRVARQDGYAQIIDRQTVFLVRSDSSVVALSSTCTHLGCRVSWSSDRQQLQCPCHGGAYDREGEVKAGPPPSPLARYATKVEGDQVLVRIG